MKTSRLFLVLLPLALVPGPVFHAAAAGGAEKKPSASALRPVPLDVPIPQSVFSQPGSKVKDPFFPNSVRLIPVETNSTPAAISLAEFSLKGLSGVAGQRLAVINNKNFAEGEDGDILTPLRKVKIHVLRITDKSAVIRVDGQSESFEIFLPKSLQ